MRAIFPQLKVCGVQGICGLYRVTLGQLGQGWDVVEKYISGQKGYEKTDTVPVVVVAEE